MKKLNIQSVQPGDRLAMPIFSDKGKVLLGKGIVLSTEYISILSKMGVDTVFVDDSYTEDIQPDEVITEETRRIAVESVQSTILQLKSSPVMSSRAASPKLGVVFRNIYTRLLEDIRNSDTFMLNMTDLYVKDDYLFHHSLNVAATSIMLGLSKGFVSSELENLGIGALLADIGMINIPRSLWNKKSKLTPYEIKLLRTHPEEGFNMLKLQENISMQIAICARDHHERFDGSGYPNGLRGDQIHEFAQIIAISDVYSALTSTRKYRRRYTPGEAMEYLHASGNSHFDLELIRLFCKQIAIYPVATTVVLNTGEEAVVTKVNPGLIHRPVVRVVKHADGSRVILPKEIDLAASYHVTIVNIL